MLCRATRAQGGSPGWAHLHLLPVQPGLPATLTWGWAPTLSPGPELGRARARTPWGLAWVWWASNCGGEPRVTLRAGLGQARAALVKWVLYRGVSGRWDLHRLSGKGGEPEEESGKVGQRPEQEGRGRLGTGVGGRLWFTPPDSGQPSRGSGPQEDVLRQEPHRPASAWKAHSHFPAAAY